MKPFTLIIALSIWTLNAMATDYHFVAKADNQYVNPANWSPAYPGVEIGPEDRIFIDDDAVYEGLNLEVYGTIEIALGTTLSSASGELRLRYSGTCNNYGTIRVKGTRIWGSFTNNTSGRIFSSFISIRKEANLSNLPGASFVIQGDLANLGRVLNYGHVSVGNKLILMDHSQFRQIGRAELLVRGGLSADPRSMLEKTPQSYVQIADATP